MAKVRAMPLTDKEEQILIYLDIFQTANGFSPTRQEIGTQFSISPQGAQKFLHSLRKKGKIKFITEKGKRLTRNIEIIR